MHVNHLSHKKATLFCYWVRFVVFKQMQRVNPNWKDADLVKSLRILKTKSKLNPMPCKFAIFCSVNNLPNLSGYVSAFDHTSLQWNWNGTVTSMNIGRLSNNDGGGNENVPSYKNESAFLFLTFSRLCPPTLWKWQIQVNFPRDSEKKLNLSLCWRPPNNVAKGNLRSCSYRL